MLLSHSCDDLLELCHTPDLDLELSHLLDWSKQEARSVLSHPMSHASVTIMTDCQRVLGDQEKEMSSRPTPFKVSVTVTSGCDISDLSEEDHSLTWFWAWPAYLFQPKDCECICHISDVTADVTETCWTSTNCSYSRPSCCDCRDSSHVTQGEGVMWHYHVTMLTLRTNLPMLLPHSSQLSHCLTLITTW